MSTLYFTSRTLKKMCKNSFRATLYWKYVYGKNYSKQIDCIISLMYTLHMWMYRYFISPLCPFNLAMTSFCQACIRLIFSIHVHNSGFLPPKIVWQLHPTRRGFSAALQLNNSAERLIHLLGKNVELEAYNSPSFHQKVVAGNSQQSSTGQPSNATITPFKFMNHGWD